MAKRVVSLWFPRLASDRFLRAYAMQDAVDRPFVLTHRHGNVERIYCLNEMAVKQGLSQGMSYADARAFCPDLRSHPADIPADMAFMQTLVRWAKRYCPWVGIDGDDGLLLDVTGSTHLMGGEERLLHDIHARLGRAGIAVQSGLADTRGAAWALAHHGGRRPHIAPPGKARASLRPLPIAALRLAEKTIVALQRLGVRTIGDIADLPRATLTRRFDTEVLMRLDQALGDRSESITPLADPPKYQVRLTLPDPIGLASDVMAGTERLLDQICDRLKARDTGARVLELTLRRVDQSDQKVELRLARAMRDAARILPLFERGVADVDAGFGIDQLRLVATQVEDLPPEQVSHKHGVPDDRLDDLITRIGNRIGLDNVHRFLPADSHIPERSYIVAPAAYSDPAGGWGVSGKRPLRIFPPEPIAGAGPRPPYHLRWRRMALTVARMVGPERIAPEWWMADENWRSGVRDYWRIDTKQGRRLWLFYTPQNPGWFVQGEFA